jgi:hypothetical protein
MPFTFINGWSFWPILTDLGDEFVPDELIYDSPKFVERELLMAGYERHPYRSGYILRAKPMVAKETV